MMADDNRFRLITNVISDAMTKDEAFILVIADTKLSNILIGTNVKAEIMKRMLLELGESVKDDDIIHSEGLH